MQRQCHPPFLLNQHNSQQLAKFRQKVQGLVTVAAGGRHHESYLAPPMTAGAQRWDQNHIESGCTHTSQTTLNGGIHSLSVLQHLMVILMQLKR
jgi:hypothetical protein